MKLGAFEFLLLSPYGLMTFDICRVPQWLVETSQNFVSRLRQLKLLSAIKLSSLLVDLACPQPACSAPNDVLEPLNGR
jgi:hypothetical protein